MNSETPTGIVSDGGSSSYYDKPLPQWLVDKILARTSDEIGPYVKTEELIEVLFGNDFDFGTLFKSLIRAYGATQGTGKAGNNITYELNKVRYYANKIGEISERN